MRTDITQKHLFITDLTPKNNIQAFTKAIETLYKNQLLKEEMGGNAYNFAKEKF